MNYEHNVFVSYRRYEAWPMWVAKHFIPIFAHWLGEELGAHSAIYFDRNLETGVDWPVQLGVELARSRVLVPLLSRQYFVSPWCTTEFGQMLAREGACGFGARGDVTGGLIIPVLIHDGVDLPAAVRRIQALDLTRYSNPHLADGGETKEALSAAIRDWVPDVVKAIERAPTFDVSWLQLCADELVATFRRVESGQRTLPRLRLS